MKQLFIVSILSIFIAGCVTAFYGDAKVKDGPAGCEAKCSQWGMDFIGMVSLGEYTDGCICKKRGEKLSMQDIGDSVIISSAAAGIDAAYNSSQADSHSWASGIGGVRLR